jgi:hypothetical protein
LLSIFSLVISCQTEEVVLKQFGKELPVTKKQVRYLDSKQSRHISSKLASKLNKPFGKNDSYDFTTLSIAIGEVDLTKVLEITNDYGVTNYTYLVNSSLSSDSKFFNLVYSVFEEKESVTLLEFTMAEDFKEDYYNKIKSIAQFKGTINSTVITNSFPCPEVTIDPGDDIQNGGSETSTIPNDSSINDSNPVSGGGFNNGNDTPGGGGGEQFDCGWLIVIIQCNGGGGHDGSYAGCNGPFKGATYLVDSCNGAFVQFYKTGKNENYNTESDGDTGDGDPCPPADGIGIIEPSSAFMNFVFNLPTDLKNWLTKPYPQGASDEIKDMIENYVNSANADLAFAEELIDSALQGTLISSKPFFKYPPNSNYATLYPNFTSLVKDYMEYLRNDNNLINTISDLTGQSNSTIIEHLTWGRVAEINVVQLGNAPDGTQYKGMFNPLYPDKIFIDIDLVQYLENLTNQNGENDSQVQLLNGLIVFSVCLHELVHFEDFNFDGLMQGNNDEDLGELFEAIYQGGYFEFDENHDVVFIKAN